MSTFILLSNKYFNELNLHSSFVKHSTIYIYLELIERGYFYYKTYIKIIIVLTKN